MNHDLFDEQHSEPICGTLSLDNTHVMHWELAGNPAGQPVAILHGGPGAGLDPWHRRVLDPMHYRIVSYDQRGSGLSTPAGELAGNTTPELVNDLDVLRAHLNIERWLIVGGSWGSSLALAYTQRYPDRVTGLILRGVFLCLARELHWYMVGLRNTFPEAWQAFIGFLPEAEQKDPLAAYLRRLMDGEPSVHNPAALAWCRYEASCSTLLPTTEPLQTLDKQQSLVLARIQSHFFSHGFFIESNALIDNLSRMQSVPGIIVQGRYDMICPPISAELLHRSWQASQLRIIANAGHAAHEPGIRRALVSATEQFKMP